MRTVRTKVYKFTELNKEAQNKAIADYRNSNYEHISLEFFADDCKDYLKEQGFDNADLRCSLSYSQGDGLSFSADIQIEQLLREFKPTIKQSVVNVLLNYLTVSCEANSGHYAYSSKSDIDIYIEDSRDLPNLEDFVNEFKDFVTDKYLGLCKELEKNGYSYIEYQNSDEYITEVIIANEYEFTKDGNIF